MTDYATLLRAQVEYKAQILQSGVLKHVLTLMLPCFAKERDDKDDRIISLCLHIVRNLLSIRDVRAPDTATGEEEELSRLQVGLSTIFCTFSHHSPPSSRSSTSWRSSTCSSPWAPTPTKRPGSTRITCFSSTSSTSSTGVFDQKSSRGISQSRRLRNSPSYLPRRLARRLYHMLARRLATRGSGRPCRSAL